MGFSYFNGKVSKRITDLLLSLNISTIHFDSSKKVKDRRKYFLIKKNCPVCNSEFETFLGHPKEKITCSYTCSNLYFSRSSKETSLKISKSLNKRYDLILGKDRFKKVCHICSNVFECFKKKQKCCSLKCAIKFRSSNLEYKAKLSAAMQKRIANGTHKGWSSRLKLEPSYPEKYIINLLDELKIANYTRELKINKWFIDFAFNKIALEIDGRQHNLPERKISDENK